MKSPKSLSGFFVKKLKIKGDNLHKEFIFRMKNEPFSLRNKTLAINFLQTKNASFL